MGPQRSPAKRYAQPTDATPYGNRFDPAKEGVHYEIDEAYRSRAERDPYNIYILKTGKFRGKPVKDITDQEYLQWLARTCESLDHGHIVKRALAQLHRGGSSSSSPPPASPNKRAPQRVEVEARFKDSRGKLIWISGHDIQALFHITEDTVKRARLKLAEIPLDGLFFSSPVGNYLQRKFWLYEAFDLACRTPGCPIDETPEEALERYFVKLNRCGQGVIDLLPSYCQCDACVNIQWGLTREGSRFAQKMLQLRVAEANRRV
ncbi:hypothetical protein BDV95DRAFT_603553 [Massariosphaeria phaeospora]|uniref:Uncharacterized protein n=1 Tax=Massariosphaeria phaeospora TaxID=100035 RepID=A0A7C8M9S3_9PLEO|nr:hypothetical protein BDV95DRAFT_603553 [Massariosphaeria phaeospora]